jgi:hypothetical protein
MPFFDSSAARVVTARYRLSAASGANSSVHAARQTMQSSAQLVDHVVPHLQLRQWVMPLPVPLSVSLAAHPGFVTPALSPLLPVVARHSWTLLGSGSGGAVALR